MYRWRPRIDSSPANALGEIQTALSGSEPAFHRVAIESVAALPVTGAGAGLAGGLNAYTPAVQVALIAALGEAPACNAVVVKGSRFMKMEQVVAALTAGGAHAA